MWTTAVSLCYAFAAATIWHLLLHPVLSYLCGGPKVVLFRVERKHVRVSRREASAYLRDVANLPDYEQKVVSSRVLPGPAADAELLYELTGFWTGLPWSARFAMRFTPDGGFHSRIVPMPGAPRGGITHALLDIYGGFVLRNAPDGVVVVHYERYAWPGCYPGLQYACVRRAWREWHAAGMRVEMEAIREAMEAAAKTGESRPPKALSRRMRMGHLTFLQWLSGSHRGKS